jgi:hypothetical protein
LLSFILVALVLGAFRLAGDTELQVSTVPAILLLTILNWWVLNVTIDWFATLVSIFRFRRVLDLRGRQFLVTIPFLFGSIIAHIGISYFAMIASVFPWLFASFAAFYLLWRDSMPMIEDLPRVESLPLAACAIVGFAFCSVGAGMYMQQSISRFVGIWVAVFGISFAFAFRRSRTEMLL